MNKERYLSLAAWLWVAAAMAAYLHQFRGLAGPILQLLGLA